ncbi:MAG: LPS assembly protein LptD, partial [Nevskiales bacterium]|nr:LPS assembly protein LptD [Nevskiales bacterium]
PFAAIGQETPGAVGGCPQLGTDDGFALPVLSDDRLILTADQVEMTREGVSTLVGTVRLTQGGSQFETQALSFDRQQGLVRVQAESLFRNEHLLIKSREARFDLQEESGTFLGGEFTLLDRGARGTAERIHLTRDGTAHVQDTSYTTCAPGSRSWLLEASDITLDQASGLGRARHARLRLAGVPVLYAPWFQFPIDDRRRSGFLFPTGGESDTTGWDFRVPFYLNLAPNYDAQITPRVMSRRGTQVATEGRYLLPRHSGRAAFEYLDEDDQTGEPRSYLNFEHQGLINRRLGVDARYGEVSDPGYFEDLGGRLEAASITHLERSARLTYAAPAAYTITARVSDYQTVARTVLPQDQPYQRLPQIQVEALTRNAVLATRLGFAGEYVNFVREIAPEGQRVDFNPYLRLQKDENAWFIGSQLDLRHTQYRVNSPQGGLPADPSRTLPQFSVEGGFRFERLTDRGGLQTLEPRLYYLYVPFRDQSQLPIFDSGEPDFDFVQLFARNRFSGEDRLSDANHLAAAFTTRLLNPDDGVVRLSASLGQIFRFEAPSVGESDGFRTPDSGGTDYIGGLDYQLSPAWQIGTTAQWSPDTGKLQRDSFSLRHQDGARRVDLEYRYRANLPTGTLEQTDLSTVVPVHGGWSGIGRWRYSLEESRTLEGLGGFEYQTCCWAVRAAFRRYQFNTDLQYTTGVYLQFELKGLARLGGGFQSLLPPLE